MPVPIIIDTDAGVDDALALLYALASPDVEVLAITTVHGNVPVEAATRNVVEILDVAGCDRAIELARGSAAPLAGDAVSAAHVHGEDGLGGWTRTVRASARALSGLSAQRLIPSLARRFPGTLTLATLGPLTNVALALRTDAEGVRQLKEIVVMGGAVREPGNVTATAEFNVFADPEAAREVLRSGVPLILVGLDVTSKAVLTRERLEEWLGGRSDPRARFLRCICGQMFSFYCAATGTEMLCLHDPLAMGVALDRSLAGLQAMKVDVETAGELTRGMTVAERRNWIAGGENADVCVAVDLERFLQLFRARVVEGLLVGPAGFEPATNGL